MKYDNDIVESVLREKTSERIRREEAADARRRMIYEALPRVREIDSLLASTAFDIIRASFGKGESAADVLARRREENAKLLAEKKELLAGAGFPTDATEIRYDCDICNDTGYDGGVLCRCMHARYERAVAEKINSRLRLPAGEFSDFKLDLYPETASGALSPRAQMREVFAFCKSFADGFEKASESLFMSGESGLGKTLLATSVAKVVSEKGFSVIFDTAFSLLGMMEDVKFGRSDESTDELYSCDLLVIDDVGCEMQTPFTVSALYNIINSRLSAKKPTVVISPLKKAELLARYGAHMLSRLEGEFVKLEFLGTDVRLMR